LDPLHTTRAERRDLLLFLLFAFVLLPLAPNQPFGPYGAINPQLLVRLVVVLMAIMGAGYVAQRLLDPKVGLAVTGLVAGFVSSSATIAAMSLRARERPETWRTAVAGGLASSVATIVQYAVVIVAVDAQLVRLVAPSLILAGLTAVAATALFAQLSEQDGAAPERPDRPFRLWPALGFAAMFVLVSIAAAALDEQIGNAGIVVISAVAAFVDAHSTTGSVTAMHQAGSIDAETARLAILTSLSTNTLTKIAMAWTGRSRSYGASVSLGVLLIAGSAWLGLLF
jgi:uncharacterized membrane protein (DUF4010 family)